MKLDEITEMSNCVEDFMTEEDIRKNDQAESNFVIRRSKALLKAEERRRKKELREIRFRYGKSEEEESERAKRKRKRTTTKLLMYFILLNCTIIEVYSMVVMYILSDLSALYSLIAAVVGESVSYAIYCLKSFNDSKEEKKMALERDMWEESISSEESNPDEGDILEADEIPEDDDHSGDIPANVVSEFLDEVEEKYGKGKKKG